MLWFKSVHHDFIAKVSLNSTQTKAEVSLIPSYHTHPSMTVFSKEFRLMTSSRLLQDFLKTIFRLIQLNWGWVSLFPPWSSYQPSQLPTWNLRPNSRLCHKTTSRSLQDCKTTLRKTMPWQFQECSISTSIEADLALFPFDPATHPPTCRTSKDSLDMC